MSQEHKKSEEEIYEDEFHESIEDSSKKKITSNQFEMEEEEKVFIM